MGHENRRVPCPIVDLAQPPAKLAADLGIEGAERLVEQKHARLDRRAGPVPPLTLSARQLVGIALLQSRQLD